MDLFKERNRRSYRIQIRPNNEGPWKVIHTGPWDSKADYIYRNAIRPKRVMAVLTEADLQAMMYGHPDLVALEIEMDLWYTFDHPENEPPNRLADFDRLREIEEREGE